MNLFWVITIQREFKMPLPVQNTSLATPPKLLDQVRAAIRMKHYSLPTEESYLYWIKKYIFFHQKHHADNKIIEFKINCDEVHIQRLIKSAERSWNCEQKLWQLAYKDVVALGLENRILLRTEKKGKNA
jgi:hypothetical protein